MTFWIIAGLATVAAVLIMARPLLSGSVRADKRAAHDEQVFRDQLGEIDRDRARGLLSDAEAEGARIEISRRLLAAVSEQERVAEDAPAPRATSMTLAVVLLIGAPALTAGIYFSVGAPGAADAPLAARMDDIRPGQDIAETRFAKALEAEGRSLLTENLPDDYLALVTQLETVVRERPDDAQGRELLANSYARMGRYRESWRQYAAAIELQGDDASPALALLQAENMMIAAGGYVSPEAEQLIDRAAGHNPNDPAVRFYIGMTMLQSGDRREGEKIWRQLVAEGPPDAPWVEAILRQAPALAPAPTPEAAEQQEMIEGMVAGLAERLAAGGGSPEEWRRLVRAYSVLGRSEDAANAWRDAQEDLAGDAGAIAFVREEAVLQGVIE